MEVLERAALHQAAIKESNTLVVYDPKNFYVRLPSGPEFPLKSVSAVSPCGSRSGHFAQVENHIKRMKITLLGPIAISMAR